MARSNDAAADELLPKWDYADVLSLIAAWPRHGRSHQPRPAGPGQVQLSVSAKTDVVVRGEELAKPDRWSRLGRDETAIWGCRPDAPAPGHNCAVDWPMLLAGAKGATACGCGDDEPCAHAVALLLILARTPDAFRWNAGSEGGHQLSQRQLIPAPVVGEAAARKEIGAGLAALDRWLSDLIRLGLGEPRVREAAFWDEIAARMLAAGMPRLSQWLQEAATIAVRRRDWAAALLGEVASMYLLARSFVRYDALSSEIRADLRAAVGWRLPDDEAEAHPSGRGSWLVLGQRHRALLDSTPEQLTWLFEPGTRRVALVRALGSSQIARSPWLEVGQVIDAELAYLTSRAPLEAILSRDHGRPLPVAAGGVAVEGVRIEEAVARFGEALGRNPWLRDYPVLLDDVYVTRLDRGWVALEADGTYLPLAPSFEHKWALYGMLGGRSGQLAATWDGRALHPLSLIADGECFDLRGLIRYKAR